jgi:lipopolysaccharide export system protein LptA
MMKGLAAASALALLAFATATALAQTEQTTTTSETPAKSGEPAAAPTPVDISANEMEILDKDKKAIFRGAVDATRGTTNLKSDELTVTYAEIKKPDGTTKTDATALDAKGNVTITTPRETITGDWAKYNPQTEMLVVGGNVKLVQGKTVLTGNELQSDLKANKTQMTGGRVKGSFLPQ